MKELYVVCDNIRSLENVGSIFRTADALGVAKIYLCGISGTPPNPKIEKASLGAEKNVPFEYHKQTLRLVKKLKKDKVKIIALEQNEKAMAYTKFKPKFPLALMVGNEVKGIPRQILKEADQIICLPMRGKKESLNVAVAFGIAGYHIIKNDWSKYPKIYWTNQPASVRAFVFIANRLVFGLERDCPMEIFS